MANIDLSDGFERLQKEIDKIENAAVKKIAREYANALEELRTIVRKAYDKHGKDGKLTYEELVKYDRIKKFDKELAAAVKTMHVQTSKITRKMLRDTYKSSFENVRDAVGQAAGKTIRGIVKQKEINEALQNPVSGLTLNDRLKVRRSRIITDIQETIGQGLYKGESYTDMSRRLKESLEGDVVKSHRIVRTESHRVMEKSKMDSLEHAANQGVDMRKYWLDSDDERVRSSHNHMGEKYSKENAIPIDQDFVNDKTGGKGPTPGQMGTAKDDIHCRCISVTIVITDDSIDNEDEEWYNETVKEAYNKAVENEPAITKDLQEIADNTDTALVGLEYRLKSKESYLRKINAKTKGSSNIQTIEDAIDDTKDVIRYTFQAESKQLVDKYFEINQKLVNKGYRPLRIKNYWLNKRNPYNGVNCNYKDNRDIKFEIQYHTEDSFNLKNGLLHELYEKQRVLEVGSKEYVELKKEMAKLSNKLEVPENIKKVRSE